MVYFLLFEDIDVHHYKMLKLINIKFNKNYHYCH